MATKKRSRAALDREPQVLLERIESQMQFVVEAVTGLRETMDRRFLELEERLSARLSVLEEVVRKNSEDIRKNSEDIRKNSEDIVLLRNEVDGLRRDFERRAELARVAALEERIARVEAKLGLAS